jgi:hypothetical protein
MVRTPITLAAAWQAVLLGADPRCNPRRSAEPDRLAADPAPHPPAPRPDTLWSAP